MFFYADPDAFHKLECYKYMKDNSDFDSTLLFKHANWVDDVDEVDSVGERDRRPDTDTMAKGVACLRDSRFTPFGFELHLNDN